MQTSSDWNWGDIPSAAEFHTHASTTPQPAPTPTAGSDRAGRPAPPPETNEDGEPKHSRKCRICLEWVPPTYEDVGVLDGIRNQRPKRQYISEDGDRLISPCLCKGSIKYMHEGC